MVSSARARWRALVGAAVVAIATIASLQAASPGASARPPGSGGGGGGGGDDCGTVTTKADGTPWQCTFADDFPGKSLDANKWLIGETSWTGFYAGSTCFKAGNVGVHRGTLRLTARDEGQEFTCSSPTGSFTTRYTGGHIGTRGRFNQTYGKFEARLRYPSTNAGVGAAWWMYPTTLTYGAWPASGEIDIAEWWSNVPNSAVPSLHYNGSDVSVDSGWGCSVATPTEFHTYGVVWTSTEMVFSIDGRDCFRRAWTPELPQVAPQPFDHPFELVLTMGVDKATGPNAVTSSTILPATLEVDYVRAWR